MTPPHSDGRPAPSTGRLQFDCFILDADRGCLVADDREIDLRPKTFAVLRYLIDNPRRLVSKDELLEAVWTNLNVTDDTLVQSIGELRRALGDGGARLIKTVPRRGYRFEATVTPVSASAQPAVPPTAPGAIETTPRRGPLNAWAGLTLLLMAVGAGALWIGMDPGPKPAAPTHPGVPPPSITSRDARPAIAVLPLVGAPDDVGREIFADGLTQDIINALGRFPELTVMSWNAVFPFKGKAVRPGEIGGGAVRYQVEGSVRQNADRIRLSAQLVDTEGRVLWSARFDEPLTDIFALQDKISTEIAGALAVRVNRIEQRRLLAKPTESLEAYELVLRARPALQQPTRGNIAEARALLRRAIERDPRYAAAYAALAETFYIALSMGWAESPVAVLGRAEEMAKTALSLDGDDVRAHVVLGRVHILQHRYDQARTTLERALAINPNDAHALAARGNVLMWSGATDAAVDVLELAQRIDPELNAMDRFALSLAYYLQRRYGTAIETAEHGLRRNEAAQFGRVVLAAAYAQADRTEDATRTAALLRRSDPTFDPQTFGTKFLSEEHLGHLRQGLRRAGLYAVGEMLPPTE